MKWLLIGELSVSVAAALVFIAAFGDPRRGPDRVITWHLWAFSIATALADTSLLALALGVRLPMVLFPVVYGFQAVVVVQRAWLVLRARRRKGVGHVE